MKSIVLLTFILFVRITLTNKTKEFCLYNSEGVIKVYDPIYIDDKGNTVYAKTIEEHVKFFGPTWYVILTNDEKSFEESKNLSIENTISKINTSGNSYQINQNITNNPIDDKCYSYIITPKN
ncbi:hypothetical protein LY90DRAFT_516043 [Neocallimastix californiae]|uniref:Uncharacterized protein n=1 Tax=Neocallimastix californiae TaxID=1754190 RepID=A0A1Y2AG77_9FUNG|nr:hypothetical protein LY90DRAFT_516043 [Neocallimastix californiae]|eukprot:ORY21551.1 hypothetical protein LY90DRAFT_516043 [Neocallimastix californiae]